LGHKQSWETRVKRSASLMGNKNSLGIKHSEAEKLAKSLRQKGKIRGPYKKKEHNGNS